MMSIAVGGIVCAAPFEMKYNPPIIRRISLQSAPLVPIGIADGVSPPDEPTEALQWLILSGDDFGGAGTELSVFVCGQPAMHVGFVREHSRVQCKLPPRTPRALTSRDIVLRINGTSCQAINAPATTDDGLVALPGPSSPMMITHDDADTAAIDFEDRA